MRRPTDHAVEQAMAILLASIVEENNEPQLGKLCATHSEPLAFDHTVQALRLASTTIAHGFDTRVGQLNKQRNSLVKFNTLPVEVIAEIFLQSLTSPSVKRLHDLARVSVHWWEIVKAFPTLWTLVDDPTTLDLTLRKSRLAPLTINLSQRDYAQHSAEFFNALAAHRERWRSFEFTGRAVELNPYLSYPFPMLERLALRRSYGGETLPLPFVGSKTLRHVSLKFIAVTWQTGALSNLTTLCIQGLRVGLFTPSELMSILEACPDLEELDLRVLRYNSPTSTALSRKPVEERDILLLPKLQKLTIRQIPEVLVVELFRNIRTERLQSLDVECNCIEDVKIFPSLGYINGADSFLSNAVHNFGLTHLRVQWTSTFLSIHGSNAKAFNIQLHGYRWANTFKQMASTLPFNSLNIPLHLVVSNHAAQSDVSFLGAMPSLTCMTIGSKLGSQIYSDIFEYLSEPQSFNNGISHLPCPELERLELPGYGELMTLEGVAEKLTTLIRARRSTPLAITHTTNEDLTAPHTIAQFDSFAPRGRSLEPQFYGLL